MMTPSTLTKKQTKVFHKDYTNEQGSPETLVVKVRFDDQCGNGHNTFVITADHYEKYPQRGEPTVTHKSGKTLWLNGYGCMHMLIAEKFPELEYLIKWHLCSSDGPIHYVSNTLYHADQHGPTKAWIYYTGPSDPANLAGVKERLICYTDADEARTLENHPLRAAYRIQWDEKTVKVANFDYARSSACWPEATDEELSVPQAELRAKLEARLPALMEAFRHDVEGLGFVW